MSETFETNKYVKDFEHVFSNPAPMFESEWTGKGHQSIDVSIDLNLNYLTDRKATTGSVWYVFFFSI